MKIEKQINSFFEIIDLFNECAILCIRKNEIELAIKLYHIKIRFIRNAFEKDIISISRASSMIADTASVIRGLRDSEVDKITASNPFDTFDLKDLIEREVKNETDK